MSDIKPFN